VSAQTKTEMKKILSEIQSGKFAESWKKEVANGEVALLEERKRLKSSLFEKTYQDLPL
jgi:ketol-acid reductoisomerase